MVLQDHVSIKNHCSSTKTVHLTTKIGRIVPYFERLLFINSLNPFWSRGLTKSCEMLKTYLPYHSIYDHQTWKGGNLLWGAPSYEVLCLFSHLAMRGQVTNYIMWKKHYIFTVTVPIAPDIAGLLLDGLLHIKYCGSWITWSYEIKWQIKNIVSPLPQILWPSSLAEWQVTMRDSQP